MSEQPAEDKTFDPTAHMVSLKGQAYLQVKDRVIWARKEHPDLSIETEVVRLDDSMAVFKAEAYYPFGPEAPLYASVIRGSGHGSETPEDFRDYIEKAETKAIGRALAALGYGTAAAFEESPDRPADAPVQRRPQPAAQPRPQPRQANPPVQEQARPQASTTLAITDPQRSMLWTLAGHKGHDDEAVHAYTRQRFGKDSVNDLARAEASAVIDWLKAEPPPMQRPISQEPQRGYAQARAMPEEPAHLRSAPDPDHAEGDRWTRG